MGERTNVVGKITKVFDRYAFIRVQDHSQDVYLDLGLLASMPGISLWRGGLVPRRDDVIEFDYVRRGRNVFVARVLTYKRAPYTQHQGYLRADWEWWRESKDKTRYFIEEEGYDERTVSHTYVNRLGVAPRAWYSVWSDPEKILVSFHRTKSGCIDQSTVRLVL